MEMWFSEVQTPDVKLSIRTSQQLYAGKSEYQDIAVLDSPAFGKILTLNGRVLFSDADDFVYNEMVGEKYLTIIYLKKCKICTNY